MDLCEHPIIRRQSGSNFNDSHCERFRKPIKKGKEKNVNEGGCMVLCYTCSLEIAHHLAIVCCFVFALTQANTHIHIQYKMKSSTHTHT